LDAVCPRFQTEDDTARVTAARRSRRSRSK
jgi:hypothetical protein